MSPQQEYELLTSRSQILSNDACPRLRLLESHVGEQGLGSVGGGYVPSAQAIPLAKGSTCHLGFQRLLEGASTDESVQDAMLLYDRTVRERGFTDVRSEDQEYTYQEQRALAEVSIRVWAARRLRWFNETYELLALEREAPVLQLAHGVGFQSRPDGVLRNKRTGMIEILSFKTASSWRKAQEEENENDVQGLSESWATSKTYGPVASVLMEYLVMGQRKWPKEAGVEATEGWDDEVAPQWTGGPKQQDSFLVRPWRVAPDTYAFRQRVPSPEPGAKAITAASVFDPNYGTKGKARTESLAKHGPWEAERVEIWREMPLKEWVERLTNNQVWPYNQDALRQTIVSRSYTRSAYEIEEWRREAGYGEARVLEGLRKLKAGTDPVEDVLAEYFPRRRKSCHSMYGQRCSYYKSCWQGVDVASSPEYAPREPNHPATGDEAID